jgi:pyruvate-formate lyase-activating enzyme
LRQLKSAEVDLARATPGKSILLFITDRCPVGCAHCSVDSRVDSPKIEDWELFGSVIRAVCAHSAHVVGISGGEPFTERRGLSQATAAFDDAGKDVVIYTSGVWAKTDGLAPWVRSVLARCSCVVLSTDAFHQATVYEERFVTAARQLANEGVWVIVQALDIDDTLDHTRALLERAFGSSHGDYAELRPIPPLPYGRAAHLFAQHAHTRGDAFGVCTSLAAPVVRYDGLLKACCNEQVIMGKGPQVLQGAVINADDAAAVLAAFEEEPRLHAMRTMGVGLLTALPEFAELAERRYPSVCGLCWDVLGDSSEPRPQILRALPLLSSQTGGHR